jgi:hypothetical protein
MGKKIPSRLHSIVVWMCSECFNQNSFELEHDGAVQTLCVQCSKPYEIFARYVEAWGTTAEVSEDEIEEDR